jgi:signal transduction histidine kinase
MLAGTDPDELLHVVAEVARELVDGDVATLAVPREEGRSLVLQAASGYRADDLRDVVFPVSESLSGLVMKTWEGLAIADATRHRNAYQPVCELGDMGSTLIVPLAARGRPFGTLLVARRRDREGFDDAALGLLGSLADHVALAIEYGQAQQRLRDLAAVEERERIARELHDTVIQRLFASGLQLESIAATCDPPLADRLQDVVGQIDRLVRDIRETIFRPGNL